MPAEKIADNGFTAEENAILAEGDDDLGEEAEKVEPETSADDVAETATAKPADAKPHPTEDPRGLRAALQESRQREKDARASMARMEALFQKSMERPQPQQQQAPAKTTPEIPAYDQDPLGHTKAQLDRAMATIDELKGNFQQRTQQQDEQSRTQSTLETYGRHVSTFKRQTPDYDDAFQYLMDTRDKELSFVHEDPTERTNRIQYEEGYLAAAAMRQGKNPAQVFYEMAKVRGYKGKQPAIEENKIERLTKGQQASRSNAGGKVADGDDISLEKLADMDPDSPEYDKAWAKFEKAARRAER